MNVLQNKLQDIEDLLELIEEKYSRGPARQIEDQIDEIQLRIDQQLKAKRHKAYLLSEKQQELRAQREKISDDSYLSLRDRVRDYKKLKADLKDLSGKIKSSKTDIETYYWLKSAVDIWEEKKLENKRLPEKILMVIGGVLLAAGLLVTILQNILDLAESFLGRYSNSWNWRLTPSYFGIQLSWE